MARYPQAQWKPLASNWASQERMARYDIVCLHTMVGSLTGTDSYFRADGYGGAESHFGVGYDGTTFQWQDTDFRADANLDGNYRIISIETADVGTGFDSWNTNDGNAVPAWTGPQVQRIIDLLAWVCHTHNIPPVLVDNSKSTSRGIAYHRQGVPGYMVAGGEKWSAAAGKVCPGNRRISQIPSIIAGVQLALVGGDIMATADELRQIVREELAQVARKADLGYARDQLAAGVGVDPTLDPPVLSPQDIVDRAVARRGDVGYARDQIMDELAVLKGKVCDLEALLTPEAPSA